MTDHYGRHEIEAQRHRSTKGKAQTEASRREILRKALTPLKRSKYRNVPTVVNGVRFASKAEAARDAQLRLLERAGKITLLERQPRFALHVAGKKICTYVGDWRYCEDGHYIVEDRKGALTPAFKIKWALAKALHPEIEFRLS